MFTVLHIVHVHSTTHLAHVHMCVIMCLISYTHACHIYICTLDRYLLCGAQQVDGLQAGDGLTPFVDILNNYQKQRGMRGTSSAVGSWVLGVQGQIWGVDAFPEAHT